MGRMRKGPGLLMVPIKKNKVSLSTVMNYRKEKSKEFPKKERGHMGGKRDPIRLSGQAGGKATGILSV